MSNTSKFKRDIFINRAKVIRIPIDRVVSKIAAAVRHIEKSLHVGGR